MTLPKISIIILNAFSIDVLTDCLNSLKLTDYPLFEILVVDCLTPNIKELNKIYPGLKLISLKNDVGPSAMHNIGLTFIDVTSKYIVFLDNDTVVSDKNWLRELVNLIETDNNIGSVQSKILLYSDKNILNTKGNKSNYLGVGWPDGLYEIDVNNNVIKEITFCSGAAMIIRIDALKKINSYDESYFIYADDLDVGLRLKLAGYKNFFCPTSIVYHKYKFFKNKRNFYYLIRNQIITFLKLYEKETYVYLFPSFFIYQLFVFGYSILNGYLKEFIKLWLDVLRYHTLVNKKRYEIKQYKIISDYDMLSSLEGGIYFINLLNPLVRIILNPLLEFNKKMVLNILKSK